ncbi:MAG: ABC transporter substrate-binding protein [Thermodesulfobacteriota bacterium]|nr:ABC transporter substrate-binding protein [Thermodesulfobacteriota bacterium]
MKGNSMVWWAIVLITCILWVGISGSEAKEVRGVTDTSVRIGVIMDQTGPAASTLVPTTRAIKNLARHINENGGIHGRNLEILIEDDRYSIPSAIAAFKKLVYKDKIFCLIGPSSGSFVNVLWRKMQKEKLPSMGPSIKVAVEPYKRYLFNYQDSYEGQIQVLINYMMKDYKVKDPRVGIMHPDTETGKIDLRAALPKLKEYDIKPVTKEIFMAGAMDASSQVMSLKRHRINSILNIGTIPSTTVTLLRDLRKFGLKVPVFNSYAAMLGEELNEMGEVVRMAYFIHATAPWYGEGPEVARLREITLKYQPGTEKPYRGSSYAAGWLLLTIWTEGIKMAGRDLDEDALIEALEGLKNFDTGGLSGPITFSATSHKGGDSWKIYKSDIVRKQYVALTGWRKSD